MPPSQSTARKCVNCKTERDDLIEHEGDLWCPNYGDCDLVFYYRQLGEDIEESERQREDETRAAQEGDYQREMETVMLPGGIRWTRPV